MLEPALMGNILDLSNLLVVFVMCHVPLAMIQQLLIVSPVKMGTFSKVEQVGLVSMLVHLNNIIQDQHVQLVQADVQRVMVLQ